MFKLSTSFYEDFLFPRMEWVSKKLSLTKLSTSFLITDFSVYCKSDPKVNHIVPVFADNLLNTGKKIYLSGKLLRLDQEDEESKGLRVKDIGPITMWSNAAGMDVDHENIIISAEHNKQDLVFNLMRPCIAYRDTFL